MMKNWRDTSTWNYRIQEGVLRFHRKLFQKFPKMFRLESSISSITYEKQKEKTDTGYTYYTHHWKSTDPPLETEAKTIILVPDWKKDGHCFVDPTEIITGEELAQMGWNVISIDLCGRGESWGNEDWGGFQHQEQVAQQINSSEGQIVLVSFGAGLNTAVRGALLSTKSVDYFIDVEGIPNKEILLRLKHSPKGASKSKDYWNIRTCDDVISQITFPYHRLQGEIDQNLPDDLRHARYVIRSTNQENFRLNDHPKGMRPRRPRWLRHGKYGLHQTIVQVLSTLP
jgi:hypothetical protein